MEKKDSKEAGRRLGLVKELFTLFRENVEGLEDKMIPRCNFSNLDFHKNGNIEEKKVFIFSDASGEKEEGLLGYVAYLRVKYKTGETVWQFLIAYLKIAKEEMTIPRRELSSI